MKYICMTQEDKDVNMCVFIDEITAMQDDIGGVEDIPDNQYYCKAPRATKEQIDTYNAMVKRYNKLAKFCCWCTLKYN